MGEWSDLPEELLHSIASRLRFTLYLLRFRSVCSSWRRSSLPLLPPPLPSLFPVFSNTASSPSSSSRTFSLSKRTLLLLSPPSSPLPSLLKLQHLHNNNHFLLRDPLSRYPITPISPFLFNTHNIPLLELAHEYVLNDGGFNGYDDAGTLYLEKVVFMWLHSGGAHFVLLTIHVSGRLALFRSGDDDWGIVNDMPSPYDDVCVFKGRLFAVDSTGRTVMVGLDKSVALVAEPVFGGDKKFLLESDGKLLLVDKYLSFDYQCLGAFDDDDGGGDVCFGCEQAVRFSVFRLDEEEKEWVEMKSLGDRVVFLGDDCAFSSSASELRIGEGNCIVFRDDYFNDTAKENGLGVFELDGHRISPISNYPGYCRLFWPPPDWLRLPTLTDQLEELAI